MVHKNDSLAAVLQGDESLLEVLIGLLPALEPMRDPQMRKTMSRLTTVEQAAQMAGVNADELVRQLNRGANAGGARVRAKPAVVGGARPAVLEGLATENIVDVDVRDDLRTGKEPFSRIMAARGQVPEGGALSVRAIFEPVPLYAVMAKQGFSHYTEELGDEDWRVWFYSAEDRPKAGSDSAVAPPSKEDPEAGEGVVMLDVRDLEPPEPMVRTLAALEQLPPGGTLVQINARVPQFLLPLLLERGFTYEVREQGPNLVRVFIRRAARA